MIRKKKQTLLYVLVIILLVFSLKIFIKSSCKNKQATVYKLENKNYCLLVADSPDEWTKGLMDIKKPVDFDGMIFIFPNKESRSFWNMNTYLNLDIYWLENDQVVGKSVLPSITESVEAVTVNSGKDVNKVVEIIK